jgi:mannose-6-phosphate isomerase-like protein (cupin superfamily)
MNTSKLKDRYDVLAPDGSEIRELLKSERGSMVHCTLPAGKTTQAVKHKTVEECWYFLSGEGEVWRKEGDREEVTVVTPGVALNISLGCHFQFRNTGTRPLTFVIITMPPWPGPNEAVPVKGGL